MSDELPVFCQSAACIPTEIGVSHNAQARSGARAALRFCAVWYASRAMFELGSGEAFSIALANVVLVALLAVLPGLVLGFARQSQAVRRGRPAFSLFRLEAIEFDRAALLYARVCSRLKEIEEQAKSPKGLWRALFGRPSNIGQQHVDEQEDLKAHAHHLRATLIRLKRQPLGRLRSWVHIASSHFAFGHALAAHVVCLALFVVAFRISKLPAIPDELTSSMRAWLAWYAPDARILCANAFAAGIAIMATPIFYLARRARLHQEYAIEFCALKAFAATDPAQLIDQSQANQNEQHPPQQADTRGAAASGTCFTVLGLSQSATAEEVKEAYKTLIKQNHPDRVCGMSPVFRRLAETESKKLNAAYREALMSATLLESRHSAAPA